jgi:hypothetical protein
VIIAGLTLAGAAAYAAGIAAARALCRRLGR